MSDYETEEQQVEAIKEWWKQNGSSVLLGIALGVGAILSWNGWQGYQESKAMEASDKYTEITEAVAAGDTDKVTAIAGELRNDHSNSSFAAMASLLEAKLAAESEDLTSSAAHLQWVMDNSSLEELKTVAAIRKARVLLADGKAKDALDVLPDAVSGGFAGLVAEVRGDIHLARGQIGKAREAYMQAQVNGGSQINPTVLGMKLDDLAEENSAADKGEGES